MSMNSQRPTSAQWKDASPQDPCPICGKEEWCSRSSDGGVALCRRWASSPIYGTGKEKIDKSSATYWLFRLHGTASAHWPIPVCRPADGKGERATPDILGQVYSALLQALSLTHEHRLLMRSRGLPDAAIDGYGYRSLGADRVTAVRKLIEAGLEEHFPRVPGFIVRDKDNGTSYWTVSGDRGILIPVRDPAGRVSALMIRRDDEAVSKKYLYCSSSKHGGVGPGSPVHVPLRKASDLTVVRVTEGALKADVATSLTNLLTIGLPGIGAWRRAAPVLRDLGATTARLAFDADARTNSNVASALSSSITHLRSYGIAVELELWQIAHGKGIDDVVAAGKAVEILTGDKVTSAIEEITAAAAAADPHPGLNLSADEPMEADDDPHRLARLFLSTEPFDF